MYVLIRPLAQQLPEINLDVFKICFFKRWHLGELLFTNLVMAFGMPSPLKLQQNLTLRILCLTPRAPHIIDLLAFLIIFATVKRPGTNRFPGIPTILDTLFRHATLYFILMFVCQFINELFLLFAPVSDTTYPIMFIHTLTLRHAQEEIQLMPGV